MSRLIIQTSIAAALFSLMAFLVILGEEGIQDAQRPAECACECDAD